MRDYCSRQLPRLTPAYFDKKADPLLHHPVRLARQRVEAVRSCVAELFQAEASAETNAERFASPKLEGLLAEAAPLRCHSLQIQHILPRFPGLVMPS